MGDFFPIDLQRLGTLQTLYHSSLNHSSNSSTEGRKGMQVDPAAHELAFIVGSIASYLSDKCSPQC